MQPHFKTLAVAVVPQPREMPLPPFQTDDLQRVFADVSRTYPYQAFEFIFDRRGAKFSNSEEDFVELRPALLQTVIEMDGQDVLTSDLAQTKAAKILRIASERLDIPAFLQFNIQTIALVQSADSDADAKRFVAERLMAGLKHFDELGHGYFGGSVTFRRIHEDGQGEDSLSIEPFMVDNSRLFLHHQVTRVGQGGPVESLDPIEHWVAESFEFLSGPAMRLLER